MGATVCLHLFGQQDRHGTGRGVGCRACRRGSVGVLKLRDNLGTEGTVQVAAGVGVGGVDAESDGESPSEGDGEEVVAVAFGAAGFTFGIYGTLNALTGQYFSVISPL